MITEAITNAQLSRAITTTKNYIMLDMGYSCNHSAGKITFTNNLPNLEDESIQVLDLCDMTGLHGRAMTLVSTVSNQWTKYCYNYGSFAEFLKECHGLSEGQYLKIKRWAEE